jgi:hypothetical protein
VEAAWNLTMEHHSFWKPGEGAPVIDHDVEMTGCWLHFTLKEEITVLEGELFVVVAPALFPKTYVQLGLFCTFFW